MNKSKRRAIEHIIFSRDDEVIYPLKDCSTGIFKKIDEALDIAIKEESKRIKKELIEAGVCQRKVISLVKLNKIIEENDNESKRKDSRTN